MSKLTDFDRYLLCLCGPHDLDLRELAKSFHGRHPMEIIDAVSHGLVAPETRDQARQLGFIYEWMTDSRLPILPNAHLYQEPRLPALDPQRYFTLEDGPVGRFGIIDNLPGVPGFCPLIRRTSIVETAISKGPLQHLVDVLAAECETPAADLAAHLGDLEVNASFEIEEEVPATHQVLGLSRAMLDAARDTQHGGAPLTDQRLHAVQELIIKPSRYIARGRYRLSDVFIGGREPNTMRPKPVAVGANVKALDFLMTKLCALDAKLQARSIHPILHAAVIAFGFVLLHPYEDGNGRSHRWLLQRSLPVGITTRPPCILPFSQAILEHEDSYIEALKTVSGPIMDEVQWEVERTTHFRITNDTSSLFGYWDGTAIAEFVTKMLDWTTDIVRREDLSLMQKHRFLTALKNIDSALTDKEVSRLGHFLANGQGRIGRKRRREFDKPDHWFSEVEAAWRTSFETTPAPSPAP